jgi:hypothetical protein
MGKSYALVCGRLLKTVRLGSDNTVSNLTHRRSATATIAVANEQEGALFRMGDLNYFFCLLSFNRYFSNFGTAFPVGGRDEK